jgi:exopolyphosphatase/guanosine-5'-triphosphate,3'-diphosphate pyrophosphatase
LVEIIPRWEWHTFARTIKARIDLAAHPRTRHVDSSEIYLASATSEGNPKIRDEKIDIKTLQLANDDGLEQWKPVLKASFSLSVDQLAEVYRALNLAAPPGAGPCGLDSI